MAVNYTGADQNVTLAPCVVSVVDMTYVTMGLVTVLKDVRSTGNVPNVTVGSHPNSMCCYVIQSQNSSLRNTVKGDAIVSFSQKNFVAMKKKLKRRYSIVISETVVLQ